jgi:hypothetical protein
MTERAIGDNEERPRIHRHGKRQPTLSQVASISKLKRAIGNSLKASYFNPDVS